MARSDLLIKMLKAAREGDQILLRRSAEALIAEERAQNHYILADRLDEILRDTSQSATGLSPPGDGSAESLVYETIPRRGISELILTESVSGVVRSLVEEQIRASLLRTYNLEPRHRMLLIGPPGNGKTSLAEAVAYELAIPLLTVRYEGVIASYLGETAARVSRLFEHARTRRCVLFFDEFDAIAKERGDPHDTGEVKRVVSSLLLQVDNLPSHVVVIAATNHSQLLDSAVWRRFQVRTTLQVPSFSQRARMLERLLAFFGDKGRLSTTHLARRLPRTSFSDLVDFMADVERKYVLGLPDMSPDKAIREALSEWSTRTLPVQLGEELDDGG